MPVILRTDTVNSVVKPRYVTFTVFSPADDESKPEHIDASPDFISAEPSLYMRRSLSPAALNASPMSYIFLSGAEDISIFLSVFGTVIGSSGVVSVAAVGKMPQSAARRTATNAARPQNAAVVRVLLRCFFIFFLRFAACAPARRGFLFLTFHCSYLPRMNTRRSFSTQRRTARPSAMS